MSQPANSFWRREEGLQGSHNRRQISHLFQANSCLQHGVAQYVPRNMHEIHLELRNNPAHHTGGRSDERLAVNGRKYLFPKELGHFSLGVLGRNRVKCVTLPRPPRPKPPLQPQFFTLLGVRRLSIMRKCHNLFRFAVVVCIPLRVIDYCHACMPGYIAVKGPAPTGRICRRM